MICVGIVQNVDVVDARVADIHVVDKRPAAMEPRIERFAKAQREPADSAAEAATKPKAESAADKADERWSIEWTRIDRSRAPAPSAANKCPAAVVEGSKAPRSVVNPGPAPGADPVPVAVAVRRPTNFYRGRVPHVTILGLLAPVTIVVEIGVTGYVAGDIARGNGVVFLQVAVRGPAVEIIGSGSLTHVIFRIINAIEFGLFAGVDFIGLAARGDFAFPQFANPEIQGALGDAHLRDVFI